MRSKIVLVIFLFSVFTINEGIAQKLEKITVQGKDIVTESGKIIRLKGVSFSDPDKLEKDGQWNLHYFQEAKKLELQCCAVCSSSGSLKQPWLGCLF